MGARGGVFRPKSAPPELVAFLRAPGATSAAPTPRARTGASRSQVGPAGSWWRLLLKEGTER